MTPVAVAPVHGPYAVLAETHGSPMEEFNLPSPTAWERGGGRGWYRWHRANSDTLTPGPLYVASRVLFFDSSCCLWAICAPQGDVGNRECGCPRPRRGCPRASLFSPVDRQIVHRLAPGHCARSFRFWCRSSSGPWVFEPVGERRARHRFVRSCSPNGCPGPGLPLEPEFARRGT